MPKAMQFKKGSLIYFAGDTDDRIFILQSGLVESKTSDVENEKIVTEYIKNGEFFGVKSALSHTPREETITVLKDSVCVAMTVPEFEQLVSSNKAVLMKMLRVFSQQLRHVHKKIETLLNSTAVNQESGMVSVAKSFYEDDEYRSCCDVCIKFLKRFPYSSLKNDVARLYQDSKLRYDKQAARRSASIYDTAVAAPADSALTLFSLPSFKRFAKTFENGQVIISEFEPGDSFYLIQSGEVQLVKCVNNAKKNLDILKPGEFFGEMAILDNSPRSATCLAKGPVEVLEFNKANFEVLIMGNPQIALILLKLFCKRIYSQKRRLNILVIKDLQARIADVFLMLDEMNPVANAKEFRRTFSQTPDDIAHWAGLAPQVVQEELNRLVARHKITIMDKKILVNNIVDMRRIVESRALSRQ